MGAYHTHWKDALPGPCKTCLERGGEPVNTACGDLQLCAVLEVGIEGSTNSMG